MKNSPFSLVGVFGGDLVGEVDKILGGAGFSDLKKPFCATAADMTSGEEVAFFGGDLVIAVAASCAIPPAFAPVCADGRKLVDGAFLNSVPSDRCVELGAEVVIGIDLGKGGSNRYMKAVLDDLYPENRIPLAGKNSKGREYSSFMLRPDLDAYRGISVGRLNEMFDIGYECALANMDEVISALDGNFKVFGDTERQEILRRKAIRYGRGA
ncbi:MAG: patatin-like phospholipase family protein, partial [Clostridia bacterium]|nr:patatin-like phospholipase family protein [Clostridia bacterium]